MISVSSVMNIHLNSQIKFPGNIKTMDITNTKVCTPTALFLLLTPGFLLQLPDKVPFKNANAFFTLKTSVHAVLFHALVFMLAYRLVARMMNLVLTPADLVVPTVLFVLLSPGVVLTIPPGKSGVLTTGETSMEAMLSHTLVFAVVFALLRKTFPRFY